MRPQDFVKFFRVTSKRPIFIMIGINPQYQPTVNVTTDDLCSLQDANTLLHIEDYWAIVKCGQRIRDSRSRRQS